MPTTLTLIPPYLHPATRTAPPKCAAVPTQRAPGPTPTLPTPMSPHKSKYYGHSCDDIATDSPPGRLCVYLAGLVLRRTHSAFQSLFPDGLSSHRLCEPADTKPDCTARAL